MRQMHSAQIHDEWLEGHHTFLLLLCIQLRNLKYEKGSNQSLLG
jgi:hypothetical protein